MSSLDDALEDLQGALDEEDLDGICIAAEIVLIICQVLRPGRRKPPTDPSSFDSHEEGANPLQKDRDFFAFDPDELGLDPEEFDLNVWERLAL